jgi:hypothetical protein
MRSGENHFAEGVHDRGTKGPNSVHARTASKEARSGPRTRQLRNNPLCSTTGLCCRFQPLALKVPGKILKLPRTLAAAERNRQDSGEQLKPLRAGREKAGVLMLSRDLVVLRMSTHGFAPILGHSHTAAPISTPSRAVRITSWQISPATPLFSACWAVVEHKGLYGSRPQFLHLSRTDSSICVYGAADHLVRTMYVAFWATCRGDVSYLQPMRSIAFFFGLWIPAGNSLIRGVKLPRQISSQSQKTLQLAEVFEISLCVVRTG